MGGLQYIITPTVHAPIIIRIQISIVLKVKGGIGNEGSVECALRKEQRCRRERIGFECTRRTNARKVKIVPLFILNNVACSNESSIAKLKTLRRHIHHLYFFVLSFIKGVKTFYAFFFERSVKYFRKEFHYVATFPLLYIFYTLHCNRVTH